jgi:diaminopimelate epimerase
MKNILILLSLPVLLAACEVQGTDMPPLGLPETEPVAETDACGAARFAGLVGQPKAVVDRTTFPSGTRVILPGTAVTMDFRAERLNVLIDGNASVERVYCG